MNADQTRKSRSSPPTPDPVLGYRKFRSAASASTATRTSSTSRWPKGSHTIEIDRFLRAMVRDIGWGFFYGWIFFDDIFGTQNHYGTVDIFAGTYSKGHQDQGPRLPRDVHRRDGARRVRDDLASTGSTRATTRCSAPLETGSPLGPKTTEAHRPAGPRLRSRPAA